MLPPPAQGEETNVPTNCRSRQSSYHARRAARGWLHLLRSLRSLSLVTALGLCAVGIRRHINLVAHHPFGDGVRFVFEPIAGSGNRRRHEPPEPSSPVPRFVSPACRPRLARRSVVLDADDDDRRRSATNGARAAETTTNDTTATTAADEYPSDADATTTTDADAPRPKFDRIYFYHVRKAGGTSLRHYLNKVAMHHGLDFDVTEWESPEVPGTRENTFYVTNLRHPVDRSISHFKYAGRWPCNRLFYDRTYRKGWGATEENARKIDDWNETGGFSPNRCDEPFRFDLCAVKCYVQAFSNRTCPSSSYAYDHDGSLNENADSEDEEGWTKEYEIARDRLMRYNLILIVERLNDPDYVSAVEGFFGLPGLNQRVPMFCERESQIANHINPLAIRNDTMVRLGRANGLDVRLYDEATSCSDGDGGRVTGSYGRGDGGKNETMGRYYSYSFPKFDSTLFLTDESIQVPRDTFQNWTYQVILDWRKNLTRVRRLRWRDALSKNKV